MRYALTLLVFLSFPLCQSASHAAGPVKSELNGKCVDVPAGRFAPGTELAMWDCHGGANQQFDLLASGELKIAGLCVDSFGGGNAGAAVGLWSCNGAPNQQWRFEGNVLKGANNRCLDIAGGNIGNGAKLVLWDCQGSKNQRWTAFPASQPAGLPSAVSDAATRQWQKQYLNQRGSVERCFGAVGSGCDGAPGAAVEASDRSGVIVAHVAVGSILHDNCCLRNPDGYMCGGSRQSLLDPAQLTGLGDNVACAKEWRKAVYNVRDRRMWRQQFGPYSAGQCSVGVENCGDDLSPLPNRPSTMANGIGQFVFNYSGGETAATRRLCAPATASLDKVDEEFCCSKKFSAVYWAVGVGDWGICK